jgi:peptide/nickel transport system permease protein
MIRYVLGRLAALPLSLFAVSLLSFSFLYLVPGDAVDVLGGEHISDADREQLRRTLALDQPLPVQFFYWLAQALRGNLGVSIRTNRPVADEVFSRLGTSIELALLAVLLALLIGVTMGAVATRWRGTWIDRLIMTGSTIGMSVPSYFSATIFVLCISLYIPDFGVVSYVPPSKGIIENLQSMFFPALSLALLSGSIFCHYVRGAAEDILRSADFVRTARAKGASSRRILVRHVVPNALIPLTTAAGLQLAYLLGGTVVIESIFALPGIGQLMLASIAQRDYPVVQGCVLLQATIFVLINLVVDLLYPILDPRIKTMQKSR